MIRRRRIVLAYRYGIALLDSGNMGMPVPTIGARSNLLDEPYGILPRHGLCHRYRPCQKSSGYNMCLNQKPTALVGDRLIILYAVVSLRPPCYKTALVSR